MDEWAFGRRSPRRAGFDVRRDSPESFRGWRQGDYAPASASVIGAVESYKRFLTNARPDAVFRYRSNIAAR
jgi:hypothetical protein